MQRNIPTKPLAAVALACVLVLTTATTWAHGDEDHSQDKKLTVSAGPSAAVAGAVGAIAAAQRLPDGGLFVPKAVQRQLGIRTVQAEVKDLAATTLLNGRVMADPNAGGRVQASQGGRIEAGPKGLPVLGQKVVKGQVLLWLRPSIGSVERGNQRAALAEIESELAIATAKAARYAQLDGVVPQKTLPPAVGRWMHCKSDAQPLRAVWVKRRLCWRLHLASSVRSTWSMARS